MPQEDTGICLLVAERSKQVSKSPRKFGQVKRHCCVADDTSNGPFKKIILIEPRYKRPGQLVALKGRGNVF